MTIYYYDGGGDYYDLRLRHCHCLCNCRRNCYYCCCYCSCYFTTTTTTCVTLPKEFGEDTSTTEHKQNSEDKSANVDRTPRVCVAPGASMYRSRAIDRPRS